MYRRRGLTLAEIRMKRLASSYRPLLGNLDASRGTMDALALPTGRTTVL